MVHRCQEMHAHVLVRLYNHQFNCAPYIYVNNFDSKKHYLSQLNRLIAALFKDTRLSRTPGVLNVLRSRRQLRFSLLFFFVANVKKYTMLSIIASDIFVEDQHTTL